MDGRAGQQYDLFCLQSLSLKPTDAASGVAGVLGEP